LVWLLALLTLAAAAVLGAPACGDGDSPPPAEDCVVARVNGRDVHQSAVDAVRAEARLVGDDDTGSALDQAIERELVREEAARLGVAPAADVIEERKAAVTEQLGGTEALAAALEEAQMSEARFRAGLEAAALLETVRDARYPDISADVAEARRYFERRRDDVFTQPAAVDLGAIFVRNKGIAGNALKRLRMGRSFEEVSRQFSIDPQLKDSGGRLGWTDPRSLPGDLGAAVAKLKDRAVSKPIPGAGGVWIFKVYERRPATIAPFAEVRDELVRELTARKRARALRDWIDRAVADADIDKL
jgi:parvulin-like peptidyl-prolyl isomerase